MYYNENNYVLNLHKNRSELGQISNKIRSLADSPTDQFYTKLSQKVETINPNDKFLSINLGHISSKLKKRLLKRRYSKNQLNNKSKKRKEQIDNIIEKINTLKLKKGGSNKKEPKVKGKRVLKNGTVAGYVRQRDGSYKWRFLKRKI